MRGASRDSSNSAPLFQWGLIGFELRCALRSRGFFLAVAVGCVLAIVSAIANGMIYERIREYVAAYGMAKNYGLVDHNAFSYWIVADYRQPWSGLFFVLVPLLCVLPYAWSLCSGSGREQFRQLCIRQPRRTALAARGLASFLSGGLAIAVPLSVSFVACLCVVPATLPSARSGFFLNLAIQPFTPFAGLYFNAPWLFVVCWLGVDFILGGVWALTALSFSAFLSSRLMVMAGSFLLQLAARFFAGIYPVSAWFYDIGSLSKVSLAVDPPTVERLVGTVMVCLGVSVSLLVISVRRDQI